MPLPDDELDDEELLDEELDDDELEEDELLDEELDEEDELEEEELLDEELEEDELDEELEELELPVVQAVEALLVYKTASVKLTHLLALLPVLVIRSTFATVLTKLLVSRAVDVPVLEADHTVLKLTPPSLDN